MSKTGRINRAGTGRSRVLTTPGVDVVPPKCEQGKETMVFLTGKFFFGKRGMCYGPVKLIDIQICNRKECLILVSFIEIPLKTLDEGISRSVIIFISVGPGTTGRCSHLSIMTNPFL